MQAARSYSGIRDAAQGAGSVLGALPRLAVAYRRGRINPALREKMMLAVSEVNACRACTWAHTRWALREGVSLEQVDQPLSLAGRDRRECVALAYSVARAEAGIHSASDPVLGRSLADEFTAAERRDIDAILDLTISANLISNTIEARAPRLVGRVVKLLVPHPRP